MTSCMFLSYLLREETGLIIIAEKLWWYKNKTLKDIVLKTIIQLNASHHPLVAYFHITVHPEVIYS